MKSDVTHLKLVSFTETIPAREFRTLRSLAGSRSCASADPRRRKASDTVTNPAQTDLLPEISRMEKRQRELRRENRELDAAGMEYLRKLRMEYDRVSVR